MQDTDKDSSKPAGKPADKKVWFGCWRVGVLCPVSSRQAAIRTVNNEFSSKMPNLLLRGLYFFRRPSLFIIYFDWLQTPIFFKSLRLTKAPSKFPHPPCGDILAISQLPLHPQQLDRSGSGAKRHAQCPAPKDRCDMHIGTRGVPSPPECIFGGNGKSGCGNSGTGRDRGIAQQLHIGI